MTAPGLGGLERSSEPVEEGKVEGSTAAPAELDSHAGLAVEVEAAVEAELDELLVDDDDDDDALLLLLLLLLLPADTVEVRLEDSETEPLVDVGTRVAGEEVDEGVVVEVEAAPADETVLTPAEDDPPLRGVEDDEAGDGRLVEALEFG